MMCVKTLHIPENCKVNMRGKFKSNSHIPCRAYAAPLPCCAVAFRIRFQNGMVGALHGPVMGMGLGMACVNQT